MSQTVLLITGTPGVGKTTTARAWAAAHRGAAISGDQIRHWIRDKDVRRADDYQELLTARIAAGAAQEFLIAGMSVAIENVWTPAGLSVLRRRLSPLATVRMVWLQCELPENRRRDLRREATSVMGERVNEVYHLLPTLDWPPDLWRIDTTELSLDAVLAALV